MKIWNNSTGKILQYMFASSLVFSSSIWAYAINNDELTTEQNTAIVISAAQLLANDSSGDNLPDEKGELKITYVDDWENGQLSFDLSVGTFTFTPKSNFIGDASFIYGAQTINGEKGYAKVKITVSASNAANSAPIANKDHFNTTKNTPLLFNIAALLINDTDSDANDPINLDSIGEEKNGYLEYDEKKGTVIFTPNEDFIGQATFVYAIKDKQAEIDYASVLINVIDDTLPIAVPNADEVGKLFFVGNMSALTYSMQSMLSNIGRDFGYSAEYDYQLGGFLFALWGDEISPEGGFQASGNVGKASHNGVVYNSAEGFDSGNYSTLIITDGGKAIPHMWGNSSQYLSRFANYLYENNSDAQSYFLQSWPFINDGELSEWRAQIDHYLPRWKKVVNTVNGNISASSENDSLYYIPENEKLDQDAKSLTLIPAALALARVYDKYQQGHLPENGRTFISEMFKSPDYSINSADNGQHRIGHLSPEGEYLVALVIHTAVYGRNPLHATNDISFNRRGWSGYSEQLFPETPFPDSGEIEAAKAAYYQHIALEVVSEFYGWDQETLPVRTDSDGDGVFDDKDAFPNDASETIDSDGDSVGDNADAFPNDASETIDSDGDSVGDNADAFPNDASETVDSDGDSVGDNADVFPNDATETIDSDGDGVGDNSDAFPNDATRTVDDGTTPPIQLLPIIITQQTRIQAEDYHRYIDSSDGNSGGAYRQDNVDIEPASTESGFNVGWIDEAEQLEWDIVVEQAGYYQFSANIASVVNHASLHLELNGQVIAELDLAASTNGYQNWQQRQTGVSLPAGEHVFTLVFNSGGFNFDALEFEYLSATDPDETDPTTPVPTDPNNRPLPQDVGNAFVIGHSLTSNSMLSMLSNISLDFGHDFDYDYQLIAGGFLFGQWGDILNLETESFVPGDGSLLAFNSPDGLPSGDYDTLILTDNWDTIPGRWGNTSQYLARFSDYMYENNNDSQTYFFQNWPSLRDENLTEWRAQIDTDWPIWQQVADTVNGDSDVSNVSDSLFFIPEEEQLSSNAKRVKMLPAGLALARLYDEYQEGNLPPNGREFISEAFKYPDLSLRANDTLDGTDVIGHLSPEGEYYIALVVYASIYGLNPESATNDITFNQRGWGGYGLNLFPQTPYPDPAIIGPIKAQYYQTLAWQVVAKFYGWPLEPTDPENIDSDGDGVVDSLDIFPFDENESVDTDGDGVGDNSDIFPEDINESVDSDGDGIGDNADPSPNGETDQTAPQVKLTNIGFVNVEPNGTSVHIYWGSGNAIRFRLLLMSHNQAPRVFTTTEAEYTFAELSVFDGISTLMIEGFDSLGNSIFSSAINVEDL